MLEEVGDLVGQIAELFLQTLFILAAFGRGGRERRPRANRDSLARRLNSSCWLRFGRAFPLN
jgi:hypothetical protein